MVFVHCVRSAAYPAQQFCHVQPADIFDTDIGKQLLAQAAYADHEKFVEIGRNYGKELKSFKQRHLIVKSHTKNSLIEFKPAQVAVDIPLG